MREGWSGPNYLMLFDRTEIASATARYGIMRQLPGFVVIGLYAWHDLLLEDKAHQVFTVPTVPLSLALVQPLAHAEFGNLESDASLHGKIKWYITPLAFGGSPLSESNITWITLEDHARLVQWWNDKYAESTVQVSAPPNFLMQLSRGH
jgi:hypothetical protein